MNCNFCGHGIPKGTGSIYVTLRGKALYFCSSKCKKNLLKLKRKPRKVRWTDEYLEEKSIRVKSTPTPKKEEKKMVGEKKKAKKTPEKKEKKKELTKKTPEKKEGKKGLTKKK